MPKIDYIIFFKVLYNKMPNLQGGKKYKSSKHTPQEKAEFHEINEADGQMIGKIMRNLGNRRMLVYCNDNEQRICRIRGALKKGSWISVGDIVLIGIRDIGSGIGSNSDGLIAKGNANAEKGDILAKYDYSLIPKLKKIANVNPLIFVSSEEKDVSNEGFDFDNESENEKDDETQPRNELVQQGQAGNRKKVVEEEELNIDDI
jgi:initiation factor 1A